MWAEMTSTALAAAAEASDVALVPIGSIEQHGSHLPVDTDINGPLEVALEVSRRRDWAVVAPPVWWGLSGAHRRFPGTIPLSPATFYSLLEEICEGILATGFRVCLLVGHGSNIPMVTTLVGELASSRRAHVLQLNYLGFSAETFAAIRKSPPGGDSHAGELETSIQLHLRPELVVEDPAPTARYVDSKQDYGLSQLPNDMSVRRPLNLGYDLAETFPEGVIGDPTVASADTGEQCWVAIMEGILDVLDEYHASAPKGIPDG
jgi:creatinine amidohydrolase